MLLGNVLGGVPQTQSLRLGFLGKLFTERYSQKKDSEGVRIGQGRELREAVEPSQPRPEGAPECGWYSRVVPTLSRGDRPLSQQTNTPVSVSHWLRAAMGVHPFLGGGTLGLMAVLQGTRCQ